MKGRLLKGMLALGSISFCCFLMGSAADSAPAPQILKPTFYKDVLPILQNNCQSCHRAGEVAPMSLITYEETRPWAMAMKLAVTTQKMPPWYADPQYGHFSNERKLTPLDLRTIIAWADTGAPAGDPKDKPAPLTFVDGWNIGKPDRVLEMPIAYNVPAQGTVDYQYIVIPGGFTEDTWIRAAEVRPGNRKVVHHVIAFIRGPESKWMRDVKPGEFFVPKKEKEDDQQEGGTNNQANKNQAQAGDNQQSTANQQPANANQQRPQRRRGDIGELLVGYAPGLQALDLKNGEAKLIKAGSDIVFQLHYTANGIAGSDQTKIGLVYAKEPAKIRIVQLAASNPGFKIPPNDPNYEVKSQVLLQETVTLADLMPHMHFRGKDFVYVAIYPDGHQETLLSVPKYDFNWQLGYQLAKPIVLPKGTRIECTAHFDNSINNPYNPDPTQTVKWGDQTWEEMMIGWFSVEVDPKASTANLVKFEKPGTRTPPDQPSAEQPKPAGATSGSTGSSQR
ncbi:MAG TPA: thiol-disulfide isomerase [Terriglobales bacterium]